MAATESPRSKFSRRTTGLIVPVNLSNGEMRLFDLKEVVQDLPFFLDVDATWA